MAHPSRLHRRAALALSALLVAGVALVATFPVFATDDGQVESTLTGTITGEGTGLAGITVTLEGVGDAVTGSDGGFQFSHLVAGSAYALTTFDAANIWAAGSASGTLVEGDNAATIELSRVVLPGISGTVTGGGIPLVDILVSVTGGAATPSATTSSDGGFTFNGLGAGTYSITFRDGPGLWQSKTVDGVVVDDTSVDVGNVDLLLASTATPPVDSGERASSDVASGPGSIAGVVTGRDTGTVVSGANVIVSQRDVVKNLTVGTDGRFSFSGLPAGTYSLRVTALPYQNFTTTVTVTESDPAVLRDVVLRPYPAGAGVVTGVLKDETGAPIPNLSVSVTRVDGGSDAIAVQTDASGVFRKTGLVDGTYAVSVSSLAYLPIPYRDSLVSVTAGSTADYGTLTLRRPPTGDGSVRGVVRDSVTGAPIVGVEVRLDSVLSPLSTSLAVTNSEGVWSLSSLANGTYRVSVFPPGPVRYETSPLPDLEITGSTRVDRVDTLRSVPAGAGSITGEIRDVATHLPVAGAKVLVYRVPGGYTSPRTDSNDAGGFAFSGLPAGEYEGTVTGDGYDPETFRITVGSGNATVRVSLTPEPSEPEAAGTASVTGVITNPDGEPAADVEVFASSDLGRIPNSSVRSDSDGRYRLDRLPAGAVDIGGWGGIYAPFSSTVILTAGSQSTLDIQLEAGATIQGFATVEPASLARGTELTLYVTPAEEEEEGVRLGAPFRVDPSTGFYSAAGLPSGEYLLYFTQKTSTGVTGVSPVYWTEDSSAGSTTWSGATPVVVGPGEIARGRDVVLRAGGVIQGSVAVATPDGSTTLAPGRSVEVDVYQESAEGWYPPFGVHVVASQYRDGAYSIPGLAPGTYKLLFRDRAIGDRAFTSVFNGGALTFQSAQTITVVAAQTTDVGRVSMTSADPLQSATQIDLTTFPAPKLAALKDRVSVSAEPRAGATVTLDVGEQFAGEWVSVWANSTPTALGSWVQVSSRGTVAVTLPTSLLGSHRIAVQDANLQTIGWTAVDIQPRAAQPTNPTQGNPSVPTTPTLPRTSTVPATPGTPVAGSSSTPVNPAPRVTAGPTPSPSATAPAPVDEQLTTEALPAEGDQKAAAPDFGWAPLLLIAVVLLTGVVMLIILRRRPV